MIKLLIAAALFGSGTEAEYGRVYGAALCSSVKAGVGDKHSIDVKSPPTRVGVKSGSAQRHRLPLPLQNLSQKVLGGSVLLLRCFHNRKGLPPFCIDQREGYLPYSLNLHFNQNLVTWNDPRPMVAKINAAMRVRPPNKGIWADLKKRDASGIGVPHGSISVFVGTAGFRKSSPDQADTNYANRNPNYGRDAHMLRPRGGDALGLQIVFLAFALAAGLICIALAFRTVIRREGDASLQFFCGSICIILGMALSRFFML